MILNKRPTKVAIRKAIDSLGKTVPTLVKRLLAAKCKGMRGETMFCPVAKYLNKKLGCDPYRTVWYVTAGAYTVRLYKSMSDSNGLPGFYRSQTILSGHLPATAAMQKFIQEFDYTSKHRQLRSR